MFREPRPIYQPHRVRVWRPNRDSQLYRGYIKMKVRQLATPIRHSMIALALTGMGSLPVLAQDGHSHTATQGTDVTADQRAKATALLKIVRDSTERFQSVRAAEAAGYQLQFGCVSGDTTGAMGLHYVNGDLITQASVDAKKGYVDATHPQIVIFEPRDQWCAPPDRRRLHHHRRGLEQVQQGAPGAHGATVSSV